MDSRDRLRQTVSGAIARGDAEPVHELPTAAAQHARWAVELEALARTEAAGFPEHAAAGRVAIVRRLGRAAAALEDNYPDEAAGTRELAREIVAEGEAPVSVSAGRSLEAELQRYRRALVRRHAQLNTECAALEQGATPAGARVLELLRDFRAVVRCRLETVEAELRSADE